MKSSLSLLTVLLFAQPLFAETLKINGSTTVNLPAAEAAEILRAEQKLDIQVDTQGGSAGGISMLGDGLVQVGMSSKPVSDDDRAKYPQVDIREIHVGEDAVALIVSKDVWDGGVKNLTKQQIKDMNPRGAQINCFDDAWQSRALGSLFFEFGEFCLSQISTRCL